MKEVQSAEPWANQSQSNTASFSQCWTAVGASQYLHQTQIATFQQHLLSDTALIDFSVPLTIVKPAILKAIQGIEQRHVEKADHLANGINGKQANDHTLEMTQQLL